MRRFAITACLSAAVLAAGCAMPPDAERPGQTITLDREIQPDLDDMDYAVLDRQPGLMRYRLINPDGRVTAPTPGAGEVAEFYPQALERFNRAVTERNHESRTSRPLLRP